MNKDVRVWLIQPLYTVIQCRIRLESNSVWHKLLLACSGCQSTLCGQGMCCNLFCFILTI